MRPVARMRSSFRMCYGDIAELLHLYFRYFRPAVAICFASRRFRDSISTEPDKRKQQAICQLPRTTPTRIRIVSPASTSTCSSSAQDRRASR
ncbi:hypothetical protein ACFPRL_09760 [Pseudoclavibacter helvolus]